MPSSTESSQPRDQAQVSCIEGGFFTILATRESSVHMLPSSESQEVEADRSVMLERPFKYF